MTLNTQTKEVLITRMLNAPRESVFRAWTDPQQLLKWYAPPGCNIEFKSIDPVQGGAYLSLVSSPEFKGCWCKGVYLELLEPERIVFTMVVSDEDGKSISAVEAGMNPEWPAETMVSIILEDVDGKTRLTLRQTVSAELAQSTGALPSWISMLDNLENILQLN